MLEFYCALHTYRILRSLENIIAPSCWRGSGRWSRLSCRAACSPSGGICSYLYHSCYFFLLLYILIFVLSTFRSHIRAVSEQLLLLAILVTVAPGGNRVPLFKQHFSLQLMLRILTLFLHISVWRSDHRLQWKSCSLCWRLLPCECFPFSGTLKAVAPIKVDIPFRSLHR